MSADRRTFKRNEMTTYRDPDSSYWSALERHHDRDNPNLIGYGAGLGRGDSHSPSKEGEWQRAFSDVVKELSEKRGKRDETEPESLNTLPQIVQSDRTQRMETRAALKRINTPKSVRVTNIGRTDPIKSKSILPELKSSDQKTDNPTRKQPKNIRKIIDPFENL